MSHLDNLPGMMTQRGAFVVANGARYQITLLPQPQDVPELADAATNTWDMIAGSLVFFPPQRNAAVVVDDRYYTFVIQPWDPDLFPQALPDVERLWNTVSQSITFFDPWR